MATKTAKKSTSTKRATSSAAKKSGLSSLSAKDLLLVKKSERHYVIFYVIFAITTVIFAGLAVIFFVYASDLETKYDELRNCVSDDKNCSVYIKKVDNNKENQVDYTDETVVNNAEEAAL